MLPFGSSLLLLVRSKKLPPCGRAGLRLIIEIVLLLIPAETTDNSQTIPVADSDVVSKILVERYVVATVQYELLPGENIF
jgi:hypothetical protein